MDLPFVPIGNWMSAKKLIGWIAILIAVFSLAPSLVPGAMSLIGLAIGLVSLVLSLLSINKNNKIYFQITVVVVVLGTIFVNDTLRLVGALPEIPITFKLSIYGITAFVVIGCWAAAEKLYKKAHNK
jgi:hypothetical protein